MWLGRQTSCSEMFQIANFKQVDCFHRLFTSEEFGRKLFTDLMT